MKNKICLAPGFLKIELVKALIKKNLLAFVIYPLTSKYKEEYREIIDFCHKNNIKTIKYDKNLLKVNSRLDLKEIYLYSSGFPYIFKHADLIRFKSCVNYHPVDLPDFPGKYLHNALLSSKENFSSTLHEMDSGIDSGKIIKKFQFKRGSFDSIKSIVRKSSALELKKLN